MFKLKKTFALAVLCLLLLPNILVAASGDTWISPASDTLAASTDFDVEIRMDTGGNEIGAYSMTLNFDDSVVAVDTAEGSEGLSAGAQGGNYTILANPDSIGSGQYGFGGICAQNCANGSDVHLATISLRTTSGFTSGTSNLTLSVNELHSTSLASISAGTLTGSTLTATDLTPPARSNAAPSGSEESGTTNVDISITTDEAADCRYSTNSGTSYASMSDDFSTSGGTSHSSNISGLSDGNSYSYYVRCEDSSGNANTDDYTISFSVASEGQDTSPPTLSNGSPNTEQTNNITQANLSLNTNEDATCKYSTQSGTAYASMNSTFATTGEGSHTTLVTGLSAGNTYNYYVRCEDSSGNANTSDYNISFNIAAADNSDDDDDDDSAGGGGGGGGGGGSSSSSDDSDSSDSGSSSSSDNSGSVDNSANNGTGEVIQISAEAADNAMPLTRLKIKEKGMYAKLKGKILLKVEDGGRAYYIHPQKEEGFYLGRPRDAFNVMREQGIGIATADLEKIPLATDRQAGLDTDGDGLSDLFEDAIGTDKNKEDTDGDGYTDKGEIDAGYSPKGPGQMSTDSDFAPKHMGKIFLQVEGSGEAWYIYDNKRYYMGRPANAFELMRFLSLGISNGDFTKFGDEEVVE